MSAMQGGGRGGSGKDDDGYQPAPRSKAQQRKEEKERKKAEQASLRDQARRGVGPAEGAPSNLQSSLKKLQVEDVNEAANSQGQESDQASSSTNVAQTNAESSEADRTPNKTIPLASSCTETSTKVQKTGAWGGWAKPIQETPFRVEDKTESINETTKQDKPPQGAVKSGSKQLEKKATITTNITKDMSDHTTDAATSLTDFEKRPDYGTKGTVIKLCTNYVEMGIGTSAIPDPEFEHFTISMTRECDPAKEKKQVQGATNQGPRPLPAGKMLRQIIRLMLEQLGASEPDILQIVATDFSQMLICTKKLGDHQKEFKVQYRQEDQMVPRPGAPIYNIKLEFIETLNLSHLMNYVNSEGPAVGAELQGPIIQALNILTAYSNKREHNATVLGKNKLWISPATLFRNLGNGVIAVKGQFFSVRPATERVLLNVNIANAAFYQPGPLLNTMRGLFANRLDHTRIGGYLKGLNVKLRHLANGKDKDENDVWRLRRIRGLATLGEASRGHPVRFARVSQIQSPYFGPMDVKFYRDLPEPAGYVSVADHFWTKYKIRSDPNVPVVNVGTDKMAEYMILEVCEVVPGQVCRSKLDGAQTAEMIAFSLQAPHLNRAHIENVAFRTLAITPANNSFMHNFGISLGTKLIDVKGRILPAPTVHYARGRVDQSPLKGEWKHSRQRFSRPGQLSRWYILSFRVPINAEWKRQAREVFSNLGIVVPPVSNEILIEGSIDEFVKALINLSAGIPDRRRALIIVVLPNPNTDIYRSIKDTGDSVCGIPTVCVTAKNFGVKLANVAMKVNLKAGGVNQTLMPIRPSLIDEDKTMIVGIDVTHPSPGSDENTPSIAAMVASVDEHMGQWPATIATQTGRQEMVNDVGKMLQTRLALWKSKGGHNMYPENILVYRDGVSEGQYSQVMETELRDMRDICHTVYRSQKLPRFTVVIVGKRHHTRFYPEEKDRDPMGNAEPGLIVDRDITERRYWDFFLQSHRALKGTARPAHYFVLRDEIFKQWCGVSIQRGMPADVLEKVTYDLCYVYGRATRAVSICTPAYYADIVCERARCYTEVQVHEQLRDTMFYI